MARRLRGLDALRIGRHVGVDQRHRLVHGGRDLLLLLRDRLALHAARRRLLGRRGQLLLLDLSVRPIEALLLGARLLLALHADDRRLDPLVLLLQLLVRGQRLLQRGHLVLLGADPVREREHDQQRHQGLRPSNGSGSHLETLPQVPQRVQAHALGRTVFDPINGASCRGRFSGRDRAAPGGTAVLHQRARCLRSSPRAGSAVPATRAGVGHEPGARYRVFGVAEAPSRRSTRADARAGAGR